MSEQKLNCLYLTFTGLTDPLGRSQILSYIKELSKKNIKFYLITLEKTNDKDKFRKIKQELEAYDITWFGLKYFKHSLFLMFLNACQCFFLSFYLIISKKIKVIHSRSYLPQFCAVLLEKIFSLKLIFDMRGFWPEELVDQKRIKSGSFKYKALKFLEKKSILASDYVVTLTPEAKEIIAKDFNVTGSKIFWMPTCVDQDKFKTEKRIDFKGKFVMIYSGSIWSFYNISSMVDFFKVLKSKKNNAHFLILGNNGTEKLEGFLANKEVNKNDYTILNLKPEDVAQYLNSSNLAISFIFDTYSKIASFPTKISEYLMCGLPVVINTQTDFLKDLINSNKLGIIIKDFDNKLLMERAVEKILALLEDKDIKERCKRVALNNLEKNVCVNKYLEIYKNI